MGGIPVIRGLPRHPPLYDTSSERSASANILATAVPIQFRHLAELRPLTLDSARRKSMLLAVV